MSLADAAATGNTVAALEALRDGLANQLDQTTSGRDYASLAARLQAVVTQLEAMKHADAVDPVQDAIDRMLADQ